MAESGFKNDVIKGASWKGFSTIIQFVASILLTVFFMHYLNPDDYGLIAKVIIVLSLINIFLDFGYSQAIIQSKEINQSSLSSHFFISLGIAIFLAIFLFIAAPFIASVYKDERLIDIFYLFSGSLILGGSIIVHRAILNRKLAFKKLAKIELLSFFLSGIIAIFLILNNYGYLAIIAQMFLASVFQFVLFWVSKTFIPSLNFKKSEIKNSSKFSFFVFLARFTDYLIELLDQFLTSIYYPPAILGIYNRSASLLRSPVMIIPGTIGQILFPLFSKINSDNTQQNSAISSVQINSIYTRIHAIILFIFLPIFILLYFKMELIISTVFPTQWIDMVPALKIFAIIACIVVTTLEGAILLSYGDSNKFLYYSLPGKIIIIASLIIGIQFGLLYMLYGLLISTVINKLINIYLLDKSYNLNYSVFLRAIFIPVVSAFIISIIILLLTYFIGDNWINIIGTVLLYVGFMLLFIRFNSFAFIEDIRILSRQLFKQ